MDTQTPSRLSDQLDPTFAPGTTVIYPMHGKCTILAIENRQIANQTISFYKLEIQRSASSRSTRQEPAIWVPVNSAADRGLRHPLDSQQIEAVFNILVSREYYFNIQENWTTVAPKLEATVRNEASIGLAKVLSYLHILKKQQVTVATEVNRLSELVQKILFREITDITGETAKDLEIRINKALRNKVVSNA